MMRYLLKLNCSLLVAGCILPFLPVAGKEAKKQVTISKREGLITSFPCTECHKYIDEKLTAEGNRPPSHIRLDFVHMKDINKCSTCHNPGNMDQLITLNGNKVRFDESFTVCVQCHGEKGRDWKRGIHGKQVGSWAGKKVRYNCTECHDPHSPKFRAMAPVSSPKFPRLGIPKGKLHESH